MDTYNVRFGLLSTYAFTIFVKRVDDFRLELSNSIANNATNPTLRQYFLYFTSLLIDDDYKFKNESGSLNELVRTGYHIVIDNKSLIVIVKRYTSGTCS